MKLKNLDSARRAPVAMRGTRGGERGAKRKEATSPLLCGGRGGGRGQSSLVVKRGKNNNERSLLNFKRDYATSETTL